MGVLVPEDFDLATLANESEVRVVEALLRGLSDGWLVFPSVRIKTRSGDKELDIVLVHEEYGVVDLEVKGHEIEIREGQWRSQGSALRPQPMHQAKTNGYALRGLLRAHVPALSSIDVAYGVVLPNCAALRGDPLVELDEAQILLSGALEDPTEAVEAVARSTGSWGLIDQSALQAIIDLLRPNVDFTWDRDARLRLARERLDDLCATQIKALESLDRNRRVLALGAAGTGKTRLAEAWVRRAWSADQRVLFTCYNEPLAAAVADRLPDDPSITSGPFLRVALELPGMVELAIPEGADHDWWTYTVPEHLEAHWSGVTARFDTIVVDEAQDFSPVWIDLLATLLDPDGARRFLMVADPAQELYPRGFAVPGIDDGWAQCELASNCRNGQQIARILRRHLGGAAAPTVAPEASGVTFTASDPGDLVPMVAAEIRRLLGLGRNPEDLAVLTFSSALRDQLGAALGLFRWEQRDQGVLGENVHRVKGLEANTVILVADRVDVDPGLLYVGVSRAVDELVVVGPPGLGARLGLASV